MLYGIGRVALLCGVALLVVGCGVISDILPDGTIVSEVPTVSPTFTVPPPTATPLETVPPNLALYPPALVDYSPGEGVVVDQDVVLTWQFTEAMDHQSLASGFRITPRVAGDLIWRDEQTVSFEPMNLEPGQRYTVDLGNEIRSVDGLPLSGNRVFSVYTLAPLHIVSVAPSNGHTEVRADAPIRIVFNRPVVPSDCVGDVGVRDTGLCPHPHLRISPEVIGKGKWVHTTVYQFEMQLGLIAGASYTVTVDAGLESVKGGALAESMTWKFETAKPYIVAISPASGQLGVPLSSGIHITFSTPMDPVFTGGAFSLALDDGSPVAGTLKWDNNGAALVFTPSEPLVLGRTYQVALGERARAITSAPLVNPQIWAFMTVSYPRLVARFPEGEGDVDLEMPLMLTFDGAIDAETLVSGVVISPAVANEGIYGIFDATSGVYSLIWERQPRTRYCVTLGGVEEGAETVRAGIDAVIADIYGNPLLSPDPICIVTGDLSPEISYVRQDGMNMTLDAARPSQLNFLVQNVDYADFVLQEIDAVALMQQNFGAGNILRQWRENFDTDLNVSTLVTVSLRRLGGALPTGLYHLSWQAPGIVSENGQVAFAVLDTHLTLKLGAEGGLVWATSLSTGMPVTSTTVQLVNSGGLQLASGATDDDGIAQFMPVASIRLTNTVAAVVGTPGEANYGFVLVSRQGQTDDYGPEVTVSGGASSPYRVYVRTDRLAYDIGDRVSIAGWVREWGQGRFTSPTEPLTLQLQLLDANREPVYSSTVLITETGKLVTFFMVPDDIMSGTYSLEFSCGSLETLGADRMLLASTDLIVAGHSESNYSMTVEPVSSDVSVGGSARYTIAINALSRALPPLAEVVWRVVARDAEPNEVAPIQSGPGWSWGRIANNSDYVVLQEHRERVSGAESISVELPAELVDVGTGSSSGAQRWTLEVVLTEESGAMTTSSADLIVHDAEFCVGLHPTPRIAHVREPIKVEFVALTHDGLPVSRQDLTARLFRRSWQASGDAWSYTDILIAEDLTTTLADGTGAASFTVMQSGTYIVSVEGSDAARGTTYSQAELWVSGDMTGEWGPVAMQLGLLADAVSCSNCPEIGYRPGDVARISVPIVERGTYEALVTIERDEILHVERYSLTDAIPIFEVQIPETYAPNVYVSVVILRSGTVQEPATVWAGALDLPVYAEASLLDVQVRSDKEIYRPGAVAELTIRTLNSDGNPVQADVIVASALTANDPSFADVFHGSQPLEVATGDTLLVSTASSCAFLGGCGIPDVIGCEPQKAQDRFRAPSVATLFWTGQLRTGIDGEVRALVKVPDALGIWRLDVKAISDRAQIGEADIKLSTMQPLFVEPVVPQSLSVGDKAELLALVHNSTNEDLMADVWFQPDEGFNLASISDRIHITIPAGESQLVRWDVDVTEDAGDVAQIRFGANAGTFEDTATVEGGIPVYRPVIRNVRPLVGVIEGAGERVETVVVPEDAGCGTSLVIGLSPSFLAPLYKSLVASEQAEIDTTEAWASYVLSVSASQEALTRLGSGEYDGALKHWIMSILDHIYTRQNDDGGWGGWCQTDDSTLHLTSYVVLALMRAEAAGFAVRQSVLLTGIDYIYGALDTRLASEEHLSELVFAFYVLSEAAVPWPQGVSARLYSDRASLGVDGIGLLALALGIADPSDTRIDTLVAEISAVAQREGASVFWEVPDGRDQTPRCQVTAIATEALGRLAPEDELTAAAIRWLMLNCLPTDAGGDFESAWVVAALADYAAEFEAVPDEPNVQVTLNGIALGCSEPVQLGVTRGWEFTEKLERNPGLLRPGVNVIVFTMDGDGASLFYHVLLEEVTSSRAIELVSAQGAQAIELDRRYCRVSEGADLSVSERGLLCEEITEISVGERVQVMLVLSVPERVVHVVLEDSYPAGFEPLGYIGSEGLVGEAVVFGSGKLGETTARFCADELGPGTYVVRYELWAAVPGVYHAPPATAQAEYVWNMWDSTGISEVTVQRAGE